MTIKLLIININIAIYMIYQFINREINEKTIVIWDIPQKEFKLIYIITNNMHSFIKVKYGLKI